MMNFRPKLVRPLPAAGKRSLKRLEFELALEVGDKGEKPLMDVVCETSESVGGDLVFVLPAASDPHASAFVRLIEEGRSSFVQVNAGASGFALVDEADIDPHLLRFARASVEVLERLRSHRAETARAAAPAL